MKVRALGLKTGKNFTYRFNSRLLQFAIEYKLTSRLAALLLITALLSPLFLFKSTRPASATSNLPIIQIPAPVSAPPESFVLSSPLSSYLSGTIVNNTPQPVIALGAFVSSGYSSVAAYFSAPTVPNGFALAQPSSPFIASVSSIASSIGSFFGLASPSVKSAEIAATASSATAPFAALNAVLLQPAGNVSFDFDGDGKADVARWHPATKEWKVKQSANGAYLTQTVGTSSASLIAPGDFDNDGKTDIAIFNAGTWTINKSASGTTQTVSFGQAGDKPAVGDYDGDGTSDVAVFRPSIVTWLILNSSNGTTTTTQFGASGDIAVAGNYDGDTRTDIAVYRPSNGYWYVQGSTAGFSTTQWGNASDIAVPADYDGDGKTDKAVFRASVGTWYVLQSSNGATLSPAWGNFGDQPVPADYDGDNKADFSVWRPSTGVWHIYKSATGAYQSESLGVPGDTAVPSAYLKQIGSQVYSYDFAKTRLSPKNSMGDTDLYSRNFSWSAGLVNLPGRAGLDAGLGISYNSLVWTKDGSTMVFDADKSNVSPGFRLGFPVIEPVYLDSATGKYNYLMVTPSGAKVEFKQTTATSIYETADSGYAQLVLNRVGSPTDPVENLSITVTTTDGTMMNYAWIGDAYRCTQIKDRNGNFITIGNDEYGLLKTITDTLGRVINVVYDADNSPIAITQSWKDANGSGATQPHTYASFNYTSISMYTGFDSSLGVYGPATGSLKVLQSIVYPGGSSTKFDYNQYGQVYKVSNIAADLSSHILNSVQINLQYPATGQTDCPRFSQTDNYAENFNLDASNVAQPVVIYNSVTENAPYTLPDNVTRTATKIEVSMLYHPNSAVSKTYVGASGWQEGLPLATEDYADGARKRWTQTTWTQDDTSKPYIVNPRVTETKVGDTTNTKRTSIFYEMQPSTDVSLVNEVDVYAADQTTVLKKQTTAYNSNSAYISRRIIGLPSTVQLYEGTSTLMSKVTYAYDEGDFTTDTTLNQNLTSVIQHDHGTRGYGATFAIGRGNPTSVIRWNVDPAHSTESVTSNIKYNTAGAVVAQITPGSDATNPTRTVKIVYADSFNDGVNTRNTFAYPTTITDPSGYSSTVKYRFDIGANVWAQSPAPQNQTQGKTSERFFDTVGRLEKQKIDNNGGAYTRYEYPTNGVQSKVYSTVTDYNSSGAADAADEVLSESWTDGAGRVRQARTEMPNSTSYSGTKTEYDILGRVSRQSVPTEIDSSWNPAGDDYTRGFLWTSQTYDWKGRVTQQTNTDGTFKTISYDGCGCAGGQVTTIQGEEIVEKDWQGNAINTLGRRTQKVYADILGRKFKTEILNWDGSVYSTVKTTFNGRDQATLVREFSGTDTSSTFQDSTNTYDGHGRVYKTHKPQQQNADSTPAFDTYNYNADDSIQSVVDARGASINYTYNSRGLLEQINSTVPTGSNIPVMSPVTFIYDNVGNRTQMTDGAGQVDYTYDQLSRLQSENRQFANITNASSSDGKYKLSYEYTLSGALKSITDPFNAQINYSIDKVGRTTTVTGTISFGNVTTYASEQQYRAWGANKHVKYGNDSTFDLSYNTRLAPSQYNMANADGTQLMAAEYKYYNDGLLRSANDLRENSFDRSWSYDQLGRATKVESGYKARGEVYPGNNSQDGAYEHYYGYDQFNNLTSRTGKYWYAASETFTATYVNNKNQNTGWEYDAAGQVTRTQTASNSNTQPYVTTHNYDSTGQQIQGIVDGNGEQVKPTDLSYLVRSSVLGGQVISEVNSETYPYIDRRGAKYKTYVYVNGEAVAAQTLYYVYTTTWAERVVWTKQDPAQTATVTYDPYTLQTVNNPSGAKALALDLQGVGTEKTDYASLQQNSTYYSQSYNSYNYGGYGNYNPYAGTGAMAGNFGGGCTVDGGSVPCGLISQSAVQQCPSNNCGPRVVNGVIVPIRYAQGGANGGQWVNAMTGNQNARSNNTRPTLTNRTGRGPSGSDDGSGEGDSLGHVLNREARFDVPPGLLALVVYSTDDAGDFLKKLQDIVDYAIKSDKCTKAFEAAKATPIKDQLKNTTVVTQNIFDDAKYDSQWTDGSDFGETLREQLSELPTAFDLSSNREYNNTGRRFIGITNAGFNGTLRTGKEYLSVIVIHAFIHTGGRKGQQSEMIHTASKDYKPHDLKFLGKEYTDILRDCTREGASAILFGG